MADLMDMVTTERDLLMSLPLPSLAPMPTLRLTPGMGTMAMEDTGEDTEVTTDPMDTMVTTERDLLMSLPLPSLAPMPTLRLTPGMGTMAMEDTGEDTEVTI